MRLARVLWSVPLGVLVVAVALTSASRQATSCQHEEGICDPAWIEYQRGLNPVDVQNRLDWQEGLVRVGL